MAAFCYTKSNRRQFDLNTQLTCLAISGREWLNAQDTYGLLGVETPLLGIFSVFIKESIHVSL